MDNVLFVDTSVTHIFASAAVCRNVDLTKKEKKTYNILSALYRRLRLIHMPFGKNPLCRVAAAIFFE